MSKKLIFHIVFLATLTILVSCSSLLYTETNNQTINDKNSIENDENKDDIFFDQQWTLKFIKISNYENLSFPINGKHPTLKLSENGHYSSNAICNTFFGKYFIDRSNLTFSNSMMTRVNCDNKTEELIITTLGYINNYSVYNKKMYLKRNTETLMIYELK